MKKYSLIIIVTLFLSGVSCCAMENTHINEIPAEITSKPYQMASLLLHLAKNMPEIMNQATKKGWIVITTQKLIALELLAEKCLQSFKLDKKKYEALQTALELFKKSRCKAMEAFNDKL